MIYKLVNTMYLEDDKRCTIDPVFPWLKVITGSIYLFHLQMITSLSLIRMKVHLMEGHDSSISTTTIVEQWQKKYEQCQPPCKPHITQHIEKKKKQTKLCMKVWERNKRRKWKERWDWTIIYREKVSIK